ncbi:DNA-binding transcriptional regulator [Staphylococcus schleiferi]|uniref:helix-turn-helix transcriptional regulator n=1 Tax=Staphylococcus sp. 191 TaxID=2070016 RepID=UPI0013F3EE67|nr:HTH domain-containing protein [Staphylococcus sp. 191]NHA35150.1 DNA-binding transcriptional regulator [Staphylococcus schleiferi]NHB70842.1 DNA-binding transcriptional regulator [Staphylococcus sp. 191]
MNKETRQNKLIALIQQQQHMTAQELAKALNVSKRTILRDMHELEKNGVQILARAGKHGGYQLQSKQQQHHLEINDHELHALYMILRESQSQSILPYSKETSALIQKILRQPNTTIRRSLRQLDEYILYESPPIDKNPPHFDDILIYCQERKVMGVDYKVDTYGQHHFENVIFIGLIAQRHRWQAVVYHIGGGYTRYIDLSTIEDISYSFHKSIKTNDITLKNYDQYLNKNNVQ